MYIIQTKYKLFIELKTVKFLVHVDKAVLVSNFNNLVLLLCFLL